MNDSQEMNSAASISLDTIDRSAPFLALQRFIGTLNPSQPDYKLNSQQISVFKGLINKNITNISKITGNEPIYNVLHLVSYSYQLLFDQFDNFDNIRQENEELRSKLAESAQLVSKSSTYEFQISLLQDKINSFEVEKAQTRENAQNEMIQRISSSLRLKNANSEDSLISIIQNKLQEKKERENTPKKQSKIIEKQFKSLLNDLEENKIINSNLEKKILEQKEKIKELTQTIKKKNQLIKENSDMKQQISDLTEEKIRMTTNERKSIERVENKEEEIIVLKINNENLLKENIKLKDLIEQHEQQIQEIEFNCVKNRQTKEAEELKRDMISIFGSWNNELKNALIPQLNGEKTLAEYVINILTILMSELNNMNEIKQQSQLLKSAVVGQLQFIDNLSNSSSMQNWLFEKQDMERLRQFLISQVARMRNFVNEFADGLIESSCIFGDLVKPRDISNLVEIVRNHLERYQEPKSIEAENLFIMLLQAVTANNIIQKLAHQSQTQYERQKEEIKQLRAANEELASENTKLIDQNNQSEIEEEEEIKENQIDQVIEQVRCILRDSFLNDDDYQQKILKCFDELDKISVIPDSQYIRELEERVAELTDRENYMKSEKEKLLKEVKKDLNSLEKQIKKDQKLKEVLQNEKNELENQVLTLQTIQEEMEKAAKESETKYQNHIRKIKQDCQTEIEENKKSFIEHITEIQHTLNESAQKYNLIFKENDELKQALNEAQESTESIIQFDQDVADIKQSKKLLKIKLQKASKQINDQNKMIKKLDSLLAKTNDENTKLKQILPKYKAMKTKMENALVESVVLKQKINTIDEAHKRELQLYENRLHAQFISSDREYQTKINDIEFEQTNQFQTFLADICQIFPDFVDMSMPIGHKGVIQALSDIKRNILEEMKNLLRISTYNEIIPSLRKVISELERSDWNEWAHKLYVLINNGSKKYSDARSAIEDIVISSINNKSTTQKLEILKLEKKFILAGANDVESNKYQFPCFRSLMICVLSVYRMKEMIKSRRKFVSDIQRPIYSRSLYQYE